MSVLYHLGKANVIVDALSSLSMNSVSHVDEAKKDLVIYVHRLARLGVRLEDFPNGGFMVHHNSESYLVIKVKYKQHLGQPLTELKESVLGKLNESFSLVGDGVLRYKGRLFFQNIDGLTNRILEDANGSFYSLHPGLTIMYNDLKEVFLWEGLKKDIAEFVSKCPKCQQVKCEHKNPGGLLQELQVPTWKWNDINMDIVVGLPLT